MDIIISFLSALNGLSPLAIIGLLALVLFYQTKNNKVITDHSSTLTSIKTNDLHELPEMATTLRQMLETLQRIEVSQSENFGYIRAKLNGGK